MSFFYLFHEFFTDFLLLWNGYDKAVVQKEIRDIENAKKGTLVVKKPVAPHPKMIVYFSGDKPSGAPRHDKLHPANLPLFINADKDLVVSPLKSFEFDRERKIAFSSEGYRSSMIL